MKQNKSNEEFCAYWNSMRMEGKSKYLIKHLVSFSFYFVVLPLIAFFYMDYLILKKSIELTEIINTILGTILGYSLGIICFFLIKWKNNEKRFKLLVNVSEDNRLS